MVLPIKVVTYYLGCNWCYFQGYIHYFSWVITSNKRVCFNWKFVQIDVWQYTHHWQTYPTVNRINLINQSQANTINFCDLFQLFKLSTQRYINIPKWILKLLDIDNNLLKRIHILPFLLNENLFMLHIIHCWSWFWSRVVIHSYLRE